MSHSAFVSSLSQNDFFAHPSTPAVVSEARLHLLSGFVTFAFAYSLYRSGRKHGRDATLQDLEARIDRVRRIQIRTDLITGALTFGAALWSLVAHRPSHAEATQAALIKYLRLKGVLEEDFVQAIAGVRPHRIETLKM